MKKLVRKVAVLAVIYLLLSSVATKTNAVTNNSKVFAPEWKVKILPKSDENFMTADVVNRRGGSLFVSENGKYWVAVLRPANGTTHLFMFQIDPETGKTIKKVDVTTTEGNWWDLIRLSIISQYPVRKNMVENLVGKVENPMEKVEKGKQGGRK